MSASAKRFKGATVETAATVAVIWIAVRREIRVLQEVGGTIAGVGVCTESRFARNIKGGKRDYVPRSGGILAGASARIRSNCSK